MAIADWTHASSLWNDTLRTLALRRKASDIVNASLTYQEPHGRWSLTAGGTNLTDDRFITTGSATLDVGAIYGSYNRPREWFVRMGVKF